MKNFKSDIGALNQPLGSSKLGPCATAWAMCPQNPKLLKQSLINNNTKYEIYILCFYKFYVFYLCILTFIYFVLYVSPFLLHLHLNIPIPPILKQKNVLSLTQAFLPASPLTSLHPFQSLIMVISSVFPKCFTCSSFQSPIKFFPSDSFSFNYL